MKGQRRRIALMLAICIMLPCAACGGQKAPDPTPVPAEAPALTETPTPYPELTEEPAETPAPVSYAATLFDTGCVHRVDVIISDEDWAELLAAPIDKTKYHASVSIVGESIETSPSPRRGIPASIMSRMIRAASAYSFRLNFRKFEKGQTYHGLDKLSLNNLFCDATYMKDTLSYALFRRFGVPAPLTSYVWLTVNGEDRGLYLAVEDLSDGFLDRNFGGEGVIYKPESKNLGHDEPRESGDRRPADRHDGGRASHVALDRRRCALSRGLSRRAGGAGGRLSRLRGAL